MAEKIRAYTTHTRNGQYDLHAELETTKATAAAVTKKDAEEWASLLCKVELENMVL